MDSTNNVRVIEIKTVSRHCSRTTKVRAARDPGVPSECSFCSKHFLWFNK